MHKKDFFPSYCFHISRFQIIFPCRDIGPAIATATLDPRPRHWTRYRDFGPATATLEPRPRHWTHDPRPATISQTRLTGASFLTNVNNFRGPNSHVFSFLQSPYLLKSYNQLRAFDSFSAFDFLFCRFLMR